MKIKLLTVALSLVSLITYGCVSYYQHVETVKQGVLVRYTDRRAFMDAWGPPDTTHVEKGEAIMVKWDTVAGNAGNVFLGDTVYDVWEYKSRDTTLYFDGYYLINWKTDRNTEQLRSN